MLTTSYGRLWCALATGFLVAACASTESFEVQAAPDIDPFSCVTKGLAEHDFTVTTAERDAGLVIAEKQVMKGFSALGVSGENYQVLTFNLLDDGTIRVQARQEERRGGGRKTMGRAGGADDAAEAILDTCGHA